MIRGVMKRALIAVALLTAGCGSAEKIPEPVERYLVYERIIGEQGIWIADVDGSHPRQLVQEGSAPELSPDGKWVAYLSEPIGDLYVIEADGGEAKLLARGMYSTLRWSPDSERIAANLDSEKRGGAELVSFDVESGKATTIMRGDEPWGWSFSPDGKQLVFAMAHGSNPNRFSATTIDLFVASRDGGEAKQITETGDAAYPVWGPKTIAFAKLISHNGWGRHEISEIRPDGTGRAEITGPLPARFVIQGCVGLIPIDWSENGRRLLAAWECEFSADPVAVNLDEEDVRLLGSGLAVSLSSDGHLGLVDGTAGAEPAPETRRVLIYPLDGGKPKIAAQDAVAPSWNR